MTLPRPRLAVPLVLGHTIRSWYRGGPEERPQSSARQQSLQLVAARGSWSMQLCAFPWQCPWFPAAASLRKLVPATLGVCGEHAVGGFHGAAMRWVVCESCTGCVEQILTTPELTDVNLVRSD